MNPITIIIAATTSIQLHIGKNKATTAPTPKAIRNRPIVFLKAPKNIVFPLDFKAIIK
jgi:hypothetical protein